MSRTEVENGKIQELKRKQSEIQEIIDNNRKKERVPSIEVSISELKKLKFEDKYLKSYKKGI